MASRRIFGTLDEFEACVGEELGVSDWVEISQSRIYRFADATDDHQWIHLDEARAATESPYGTTVAHGYLTLSMLPRMTSEVFELKPRVAGINYGLDKVRFIAPVLAGTRIRGRVTLDKVAHPKPGTVQAHMTVTVEIEDGEKPACVAESIAQYIMAA